jgi:predicted NUDIX family NTP pyrophosphohydrolase
VRQVSAGILLYRRREGDIEVLLVRPGGPFWRGRDAGAWMIPKGGIAEGETALAAAAREFEEELGTPPPAGDPVPLPAVRQKGGKWVEAFALEGDFDPSRLASNSFSLEYPPGSGRFRDFPEVEEARWFVLGEARAMMLASQLPLLDALEALLSRDRTGGDGRAAGSADTGSAP